MGENHLDAALGYSIAINHDDCGSSVPMLTIPFFSKVLVGS